MKNFNFNENLTGAHPEKEELTEEKKCSAGEKHFIFSAEDKTERADTFLLQELLKMYPELNRSRVKNFFEKGFVSSDGKPIKAGTKLRPGKHLELLIKDYVLESSSNFQKKPLPLPMTLDIRYEDDCLIVLNKPRGLVVHPAPGHKDDTLVNALIYRYGMEGLSDLNGEFRPGIVHRLDKDTSGLMIVVKNSAAHRKLAEALKKHDIRRHYVAVVYGIPESRKGIIDMPIGRDRQNRLKMAVDREGKRAVTHFSVRESKGALSVLDIDLETGRTHQIRVHLAKIGHPVVGDPVYAKGRDSFGMRAQALHASAIEFTHPVTGKNIKIECELPEDMEEMIASLSGDGR